MIFIPKAFGDVSFSLSGTGKAVSQKRVEINNEIGSSFYFHQSSFFMVRNVFDTLSNIFIRIHLLLFVFA